MRTKLGVTLLVAVIGVMLISCAGGSSNEAQPASGDVKSDTVHDYNAPASESQALAFESEEISRQGFSGNGSGGGVGLGINSDSGAPPPRAGWNNPNDEPYDLTFFENYGVNPFIATEDENTSTFGMDVDTASYTIMRRYIFDGNPPESDSIRTEEFINYFEQDYPEPARGDVFSLTVDGAESQFGQPNYHLLRVGIKARDVSLDDRPAANMIFVVDVSGSMNREDRLEQVKRSLRMLASNLKRGDEIGLVVYGSTGQVISDLTGNHDAILRSIELLQPGGSTNAGQGLELAYEMARRNFDADKVNRIILCSDGVANTGITEADAILAQVKADALNGITLTTMGFGMGNYNDVLLEKLANHGDGMYYYIDSDEEAQRIFGDGAASMLLLLASDAKIQVEFNEEVVERFRLLGYENRRLNEEDFEDDTIDAGEVGAGQTVTALYEIRINDDVLKDSRTVVGEVRIRFLNLQTGEIDVDSARVSVRDLARPFDEADSDFRFTAAVAEFAEILKESYWAEGSMLSDVLAVSQECADNNDEREFCEIVEAAVRLED